MVRKPDLGGVQFRSDTWCSPLFRTVDILGLQETCWQRGPGRSVLGELDTPVEWWSR